AFGIGNHAVHHEVPGLCAPALAIGLWFRRKDASAAAAPFRVLLSRRYRHLCALHAERGSATMAAARRPSLPPPGKSAALCVSAIGALTRPLRRRLARA